MLHVPLNFLFIYGFGFGWRGAAVATSLNQILTPLVLIAIITGYRPPCFAALCARLDKLLVPSATASVSTTSSSTTATFTTTTSEYLKCWPGWRWEALELQPMIDFLRLALGGLVMIMEWWASEIAILMAGAADGSIGLSTLAIYQTTLSTIFMFSVGFQVSAATRVGQFLGKNRPFSARRAAAMAPLLVAAVTCCLSAILFTFRKPIPFFFVGHGEEDLAARVTNTYGFLCFYVVGDGISTAFGGIILGAGKQTTAGVVVIVAYFFIALPLAFLLAFRKGYGYMGCVEAMTVGTFFQMMGNGLICASLQWVKEAATAAERAGRRSISRGDPSSSPSSSSSSSSSSAAYAKLGRRDDEDEDEDHDEDEDEGNECEGDVEDPASNDDTEKLGTHTPAFATQKRAAILG